MNKSIRFAAVLISSFLLIVPSLSAASTANKITSPINGATITGNSLTVSGTCAVNGDDAYSGIHINHSVGGTTLHCVNNTFSDTVSLSALPNGLFTVQVVGYELTLFNRTIDPSQAASCTLDGVTLASGQSFTFFLASTIQSPNTCNAIAQSRTCVNGVLTGSPSFDKASCTVIQPGSASPTVSWPRTAAPVDPVAASAQTTGVGQNTLGQCMETARTQYLSTIGVAPVTQSVQTFQSCLAGLRNNQSFQSVASTSLFEVEDLTRSGLLQCLAQLHAMVPTAGTTSAAVTAWLQAQSQLQSQTQSNIQSFQMAARGCFTSIAAANAGDLSTTTISVLRQCMETARTQYQPSTAPSDVTPPLESYTTAVRVCFAARDPSSPTVTVSPIVLTNTENTIFPPSVSVSPVTWINASNPSSTTVPACRILSLSQTLQEGSHGDNVTRLQAFLAAIPNVYPEGLVTGYFGPLTVAAVQRWQMAHGIISWGSPATTGYGVIGPRTLMALLQCD